MKKLTLLTALLTCFISPAAFCQAGHTVLENMMAKIKTYVSVHIAEKAYLHFDKPYYAAGDTVYFKAYLTAGEKHQLSGLSGVLHVDLINTNNKIAQSIKLQSDSGIAHGDFALPDSLPPGNYRVRAYTQWMRNNNNYGFFEQTIPVGSLLHNTVAESVVKSNGNILSPKTDLQFFPEAGSLVTGLCSKVAFKAIGINGEGINVKGTVFNQNDKAVCSFSSVHLGMGYFYLQPKDGETYKVRFTDDNGLQGEAELPKPEISGIVLSVDNDSIPKASVRITANPAYYQANRNKDYTVLISSRNKTITVNCKLDSQVLNFDILKRKLSTGIITVTLFSETGEPLCERLFFVQNYDQLSLNISSDKNQYGKREKVIIKLNVKNRGGSAANGHFSVSVTNENKVPFDENKANTILTNLLLTSDLKGYVEEPNYYFTDTSANARLNLDILMLTQGYRRFEWKQVLNNGYPAMAYQPEKGLEISGTVTSLLGKPLNKSVITLLPFAGGPLLSTASDDKGRFHFSNLIFDDTTHFILSAVKENGKNSTKITYNPDKDYPIITPCPRQNRQIALDTAMSAYLKNTKIARNEAVNYGKTNGIVLKEVKIKDKKRNDQYETQSLAGAGNADQVMHSDELERIAGQLTDVLNGRLRGVTFVKQGPSLNSYYPVLTLNLMSGVGDKNLPSPMTVIVDGMYLDPPDINNITARDVETVEVLKYASASIYGVNGGNGVLIITTKRGGGLNSKDIASIGILPISPIGFYKAREFYAPKYDATNINTKQPDLRSTIYWEPEIKTDKNGYASFEFYNADGAGTYKVVVEGIDENGNLGRQVYRYKVE